MSWRARLDAALDRAHDRPQTHDMFLYGEQVLPQGPFTPAAVLIAVTARTAPGLLFTQRASGLRTHSGQVAFPGGRVDPGDADARAAALREAEEEIALPRHMVEFLGHSDLFLTGTGFAIEPVLGIVPPDLPLIPAMDEVEAIFEVPLDFLLDPANCQRRRVPWEGGMRNYYEFQWQEHRIWGVTAAIIVNLIRRIEAA